MSDSILGFFGETRWLSNFQFSPIEYNGLTFPTSEHLYQYLKAADPEEALAILEAPAPAIAKKLGGCCKLKPELNDATNRVNLMEKVVRLKFEQNKDLSQRLIDTGDAYLEETNGWVIVSGVYITELVITTLVKF